eukprot:5872433-Pyramimonas_sp.AAC.2
MSHACFVGLDTDTVEWTVKTLSSCLITLERIQLSHQVFKDAVCPCRALVPVGARIERRRRDQSDAVYAGIFSRRTNHMSVSSPNRSAASGEEV